MGLAISRIPHLAFLNLSNDAHQGLWKGLRALKIFCEGVGKGTQKKALKREILGIHAVAPP